MFPFFSHTLQPAHSVADSLRVTVCVLQLLALRPFPTLLIFGKDRLGLGLGSFGQVRPRPFNVGLEPLPPLDQQYYPANALSLQWAN